MYDLLIYALKSGVCLAVFYLFFKLSLSRETLHRFNRIVVLAGMALAFVLPLCVVTVYRELPPLPAIAMEETAELPTVLPEPSAAFDWKPLLGALYLLGAVVMLSSTVRSLVAILCIVRSGRRRRLDAGSILVLTGQPVTPFSWGRYIVISEEDMAVAGREILTHEQAHLHRHHSVDLLVTDLIGCLQWFNPAMWLLRRELRAIHEYEADRAVIESGIEARDYQLLLIRKAVGGRWYSVANSFNHSKLKNRITMMLRRKSSRWTGARALFVLPLTVAALGAFAETAYVVPDDKVKKESVTVDVSGPNISLSGLDGEPLVLIDGKEMPLQAIPAERIASIDVHKDSETTAAYGEKDKNGVVLITTKRTARTAGKAQSIRFSPDRKTTIDGGSNTLSNGKILYIVDGVPVDDIDKLPANKIGNITIMKNNIPEEYKKQSYDGMMVVITKNSSAGRDKTEAYFNSDEWKAAQKQLEKADKYFRSDEWKAKQKRLVDVDEYFKSDEWKQAQKKMAEASAYFRSDEWETAMQRLTEAGLQTAEAEKELNGQLVSIHADRDKKQQGESSEMRTKGRITVIGTNGVPDDCLILINGKRATKAEMEAIPSGKIRRMNIYKGQQAIDKFGPEAAHGVIDVKARKR